MSLKWPEPMPENGRMSKWENDAAWGSGLCLVIDPKRSCPQTLNITLFFDGTNNNDDEKNPWRDSLTQTHTNVARLYNAAVVDENKGIFPFYIPGVGTPFPEIGESLYTTKGKAFATGFGARCVWGYTRVLNAVYQAIRRDPDWQLIRDDNAKWLCAAGARGDMTGFEQHVNRLGIAHRQAVNEHAWPRTVRQVWINVIGFSRGAACARAFAHKLIHEWAPGGKLGTETGKYAIPYRINFMGLFDTVASVGLPDSTRSVLNLERLDGHAGFAGGGAMAIPDAVRFCVHAFSIHEQRMSFPLDSICKDGKEAGDCRHEIGYPGVHSDVGGGYGPGAQGKGCGDSGQGDDSRKLSQIPLHDMYIAALGYGVPLMRAEAIQQTPGVAQDFDIHPSTVATFNAWLRTVEPMESVGSAMKFGMGQMLGWRTLRAQPGGSYITEQRFFRNAPENPRIPRQLHLAVAKAQETDPQLKALTAQLNRAQEQKTSAVSNRRYPLNMPEVIAADSAIEQALSAIRLRKEQLCGEVANPEAKPGPVPNTSRPGETPYDFATNDQTDLRQGAEEMRLLLGHLYPEQRDQWQVREVMPGNASPYTYPPPRPAATVLSVRREGVRNDPPGSASPLMTLVPRAAVMAHSISTLLDYGVDDDVLVEPMKDARHFLKRHASLDAARRLPPEIVELLDNYVHDSRCWFRVPHFHEYAPGGYFWPRIVFTADNVRLPWLGFDPLSVAFDADDAKATAFA